MLIKGLWLFWNVAMRAFFTSLIIKQKHQLTNKFESNNHRNQKNISNFIRNKRIWTKWKFNIAWKSPFTVWTFILTAQLHSTKPELHSTQVLRKFKSCSRPVGDSCCWGSLTMIPAENKAKRLSSVNHTKKTIHHHLHPHQVAKL